MRRRGVLRGSAAGRGHVQRAAPDQHLLLAPLGPRIVLVEAAEIAIVALVQALRMRVMVMLEDLVLFEDQVERMLAPARRRRG